MYIIREIYIASLKYSRHAQRNLLMNSANPSYNCVVCFREYNLARRNVNPQNASFSCKLSLLSLTKRSRKARNRMVAVGFGVTRTSKSLCRSRPGCIISFGKGFHPLCRNGPEKPLYRSYR